MTQKKHDHNEKYYTYTEFKECFFPNLKIEQDDAQPLNESLLDVLGNIENQNKPNSKKGSSVKDK